MNIKTLSVILSALAVIAACVFGVVHTNSKTEIANANAAKAQRDLAAAESAERETKSAEKAAKSSENAEKAKLETEQTAARKAEENRKAMELQLEKSKVDARIAEENKKKSEADAAKASEDRARAEAESKKAADNRAAEKAKVDAAKIERDKAKILAEAEAAKAQAAADQLEREKLASEKIIAERKVYEFRLMDIARMERELAEYKMELDERERALHPEMTIRDLDSADVTEETVAGAEKKLPENDLEQPRSSRTLYRSQRLRGEADDRILTLMRLNTISRLEKLYVNALKEDRIVDAKFYETQLKTMYPDWKFTTKETESK